MLCPIGVNDLILDARWPRKLRQCKRISLSRTRRLSEGATGIGPKLPDSEAMHPWTGRFGRTERAHGPPNAADTHRNFPG